MHDDNRAKRTIADELEAVAHNALHARCQKVGDAAGLTRRFRRQIIRRWQSKVVARHLV